MLMTMTQSRLKNAEAALELSTIIVMESLIGGNTLTTVILSQACVTMKVIFQLRLIAWRSSALSITAYGDAMSLWRLVMDLRILGMMLLKKSDVIRMEKAWANA